MNMIQRLMIIVCLSHEAIILEGLDGDISISD